MQKGQGRPRGSDSAGRIITQHRPNRTLIIKPAQQAKMTGDQIRFVFHKTVHNALLAMVKRDFQTLQFERAMKVQRLNLGLHRWPRGKTVFARNDVQKISVLLFIACAGGASATAHVHPCRQLHIGTSVPSQRCEMYLGRLS
jgi:hypothetical protein